MRIQSSVMSGASRKSGTVDQDLSRDSEVGVLIAIFWIACLAPLVTAAIRIVDLSGVEAPLLAAFFVLRIVSTGRFTLVERLLLALLAMALGSAFFADVNPVAALVSFAFLACPIVAMDVTTRMTDRMARRLRGHLYLVGALQFAFMCVQLIQQTHVDDLKGTFVGTQYGAHIAAYIVLLAAAEFWRSTRRVWTGRLVVGLAVAIAIAADSKVALVSMGLIAFIYLARGGERIGSSDSSRLPKLFASGIVVAAGWAFANGSFGNIALTEYIANSVDTGGGKVAVAVILTNPADEFWSNERSNFLTGAGPGQTVSRVAQMSVANSQGSAPVAEVGGTPSRYYRWFQSEAQGRGFVGDSSATAPASSLLGVLGDIGILGLMLYGSVWLYGWRRLASNSGWLSWPGLVWMGFLVPALVGEWLEFPAASLAMGIAAGIAARNVTLLNH